MTVKGFKERMEISVDASYRFIGGPDEYYGTEGWKLKNVTIIPKDNGEHDTGVALINEKTKKCCAVKIESFNDLFEEQ